MGEGTGVQAAARGEQSGEFFRYGVELPVTIPRKESAMVPIVVDAIAGKRIAIYNTGAHPIHPFNAVRITNNTGLDLKGGPVTLFESGTYAGDAVLESLSRDQEAILSYSLDIKTAVSVERERPAPETIGVKIEGGVLIVDILNRSRADYEVRSGDSRDRTVLVEHPILHGWELVEPEEPHEKTPNYYRFSLDFPAGAEEVKNLIVMEEYTSVTQTRLEGMNSRSIEDFLSTTDVSAGVRSALTGIVTRRNAIDEVVNERNRLNGRRNDIFRDQERIRNNMESLDRESDLYKRYEEQLENQENELDRIVADVTRLAEQERRLREEPQAYTSQLQAK